MRGPWRGSAPSGAAVRRLREPSGPSPAACQPYLPSPVTAPQTRSRDRRPREPRCTRHPEFGHLAWPAEKGRESRARPHACVRPGRRLRRRPPAPPRGPPDSDSCCRPRPPTGQAPREGALDARPAAHARPHLPGRPQGSAPRVTERVKPRDCPGLGERAALTRGRQPRAGPCGRRRGARRRARTRPGGGSRSFRLSRATAAGAGRSEGARPPPFPSPRRDVRSRPGGRPRRAAAPLSPKA